MKINLPFTRFAEENAIKGTFPRDVNNFIITAMVLLSLLWTALMLVYPARAEVWLTFYVPMMVVFFVGLRMNSDGKTRATVIMLLVSVWAILTLIQVLYSNVIPLDNNRYLLLVVTAGLLFGKRGGVTGAIVCGVTEIILAILLKNHIIASALPDASMHMLLPHLFFLAMAAVVPAFATRSVRMALRAAEEERDERRMEEDQARVNHERYLSVIDNSPDPIMVHADGRFVHLNPAALKFIKAESEERLLGESIMKIVHPDYRDLVGSALRNFEQTMTSSQIREGKLLKLDGSEAIVETASMPVTFVNKRAIQTMVRDVTELRHLQEEMHLRIAALNSAGNAIIITDREGRIVWANPAFENLTGYSFDEVVGSNPKDLIASGKQGTKFYEAMWKSILEGSVWHGELVNKRKDGSLYDEHMTITPVRSDHGEITHFVAVKQDITAQKRLEEQLLQSQKLEGIGQLAGGVAHDYNNILNVVVGYSDLLRRKMAKDDPARQPIEAILAAAHRGADLSRQLLAFARKEIISPRVINVNSAIDSIRNMLHRIIGENLKLLFEPGKGVWNVKIDPTQFDQILVNLVSNAKDAIEDIGTISIRTFNRSFTRSTLPDKAEIAPGDYVTVEIEDDGKGIDKETLKRLFEPFFTTKPKGHGTGLGLSTVYGILKQNGGTIEVSSKFGKGSTFTVYLPRFAGETRSSEVKISDDSLKGTETVLVVEDQADLLNLTKTFLEECGYNVITSLDPTDAELLSDAYTGTIHLLLTDVIMPKMSGKELSERLAIRRPGMRTLFMSGYTSDTFGAGVDPGQGLDLILKPFDLSELATRVREVLSRKSQMLSRN